MLYGQCFMSKGGIKAHSQEAGADAGPHLAVVAGGKDVYLENMSKEAVRFGLNDDEPENAPGSPVWLALQVVDAKKRLRLCRINPDLAAAPYWRLGDCVWLVGNHWSRLPLDCGQIQIVPLGAHGETKIAVSKTRLDDGNVVAMIDTVERVQEWSSERPPEDIVKFINTPLKYATDGQHRVGNLHRDEYRKRKKDERQRRGR
jgi:hypothetical protein